MARSTFKLCALVLFINLIVGCKSDPLPRPTQNGANIFGCKINGQAWIPDGGGLFSLLNPINAYYLILPTKDYKLGISLSAYSSDRRAIRIQLNDIKAGSYTLINVVTTANKDSISSHASYSDRRGPTSLDEVYYRTTNQYGGQVIVTRSDSVAKIISGTFNFTVTDGKGRTAIISDGRFDVKYPLR